MFDRLPTLALVSDPTRHASATCFLRHPSEPAGVSASPKQEQGVMQPDKQVKHGITRELKRQRRGMRYAFHFRILQKYKLNNLPFCLMVQVT